MEVIFRCSAEGLEWGAAAVNVPVVSFWGLVSFADHQRWCIGRRERWVGVITDLEEDVYVYLARSCDIYNQWHHVKPRSAARAQATASHSLTVQRSK